MRAALYVRVSTEDQAREGFSLDAQTKKLEAYCRFRGFTVHDIYRDEGCSGRNTDRPEYKRMMEESDDWDDLIVLKLDRIHRNSVNFALMMNELGSKGKNFTSVQEDFDTSTAMGRFAMDIIQRIAQLESEQIGERVKFGMVRKAKYGSGSMGSGHPYGYVYEKGSLIVIEYEAEVVKEIYAMYSDGMSYRSIADTLNDSSIPTKMGKKWYSQSVSNILHNPVYAGYIKWDGIVRGGEHAAIIGQDVFESINGPIE
jgi:DNA invertase Pin-like site-specific DNA recombinase